MLSIHFIDSDKFHNQQAKIMKYLALVILVLSSDVVATDPTSVVGEKQSFPPRGANVQASAGYCSVGPFGTTGATGMYKLYCTNLTSAEKCLAYLKQHFLDDGNTTKVFDSAKAKFCLSVMSATLFR